MSKTWRRHADRFDALSTRERGLIALTLLVALGFAWWSLYAEPQMARLAQQTADNERLAAEVGRTRAVVADIRARLASGVHRQKESELALLQQELARVEERLKVETVELIDPEKMFRLMHQLVSGQSRLKLLGLKRREVRPALPVADGDETEPAIYRHVLEIEFAGRYLDILDYVQSLEALDWKLLWDEIEIASGKYPAVTLRLAISTLSTDKAWVGI